MYQQNLSAPQYRPQQQHAAAPPPMYMNGSSNNNGHHQQQQRQQQQMMMPPCYGPMTNNNNYNANNNQNTSIFPQQRQSSPPPLVFQNGHYPQQEQQQRPAIHIAMPATVPHQQQQFNMQQQQQQQSVMVGGGYHRSHNNNHQQQCPVMPQQQQQPLRVGGVGINIPMQMNNNANNNGAHHAHRAASFNNQQHQQHRQPIVIANTQQHQMPSAAGPMQHVSVVPYVVPALTPALTANVAVIKPSHQVLIVKPLPAFLTEDEDLLALAKGFVLPCEHAAMTERETERILVEGDEAVLAKMRAIDNTDSSNSNIKKSSSCSAPKKVNMASAAPHCNYLPFAAKVIRKSVLSAVTASYQRSQQQQQQSAAAAFLDAVAGEHHKLLGNSACFCEEGYGFLLFATEEAGLTYLRAVEKLSSAAATNNSISNHHPDETSLGARPTNVSAVRSDFDEIESIKRRVYQDAYAEYCASDDDDENNYESLHNASFTSSVSSSSCDSATSFDSNSSFGSVASELNDDDALDNDAAKQQQKPCALNSNPSNKLDCDHCSRHRRMYRIYYRAKMNRFIDGVRVKCAVVVAEAEADGEGAQKKNKSSGSGGSNGAAADNDAADKRRPATFNGVPNASKEHIAEMRGLFAQCFFNTNISVAGGDGTVAAKPRTKAVPLFIANTTTNTNNNSTITHSTDDNLLAAAESSIVSSLAEVPLAQKVVAVHRPVIIDCTAKDRPTIAFMGMGGGASSLAHPISSKVAMSVVSEDLSRVAADLIQKHSATANPTAAATSSSSALRPFSRHHHTHHRHCVAHRALAVAKRLDVRRQRAIQTRLYSRARQAPHVVSVAVVPPPAVAAVPIVITNSNTNGVVPSVVPAVVKMLPPAYVASAASPVPPPSYTAPVIVAAAAAKQQAVVVADEVTSSDDQYNTSSSDNHNAVSTSTTAAGDHNDEEDANSYHDCVSHNSNSVANRCGGATTALAASAPASSEEGFLECVDEVVQQQQQQQQQQAISAPPSRFRHNPYGCGPAASVKTMVAAPKTNAPAPATMQTTTADAEVVEVERSNSVVSMCSPYLSHAGDSEEGDDGVAAVAEKLSIGTTAAAVVFNSNFNNNNKFQQHQQVSVDPYDQQQNRQQVHQQQQQVSVDPYQQQRPVASPSAAVSSAPPMANGGPKGRMHHPNNANNRLHHNQQQHGPADAGTAAFASLLPAWAQPANVNNAGAKFRNMFSMSKAKRF